MDAVLNIPLVDGDSLPLPLTVGNVVFLVGPNGSGKSALIQHAVSSLGPSQVRRISAHRQTWLQSGNIDQTAQSRMQFDEQLKGQEPNPIYRYRDFNPQARLGSVLFDLYAKETALALNIMRHAYQGDFDAIQNATDAETPVFTQINQLLAIAGLPVSIESADGGRILSRRQGFGEPYSIAQMSDGERSAVLMAAEVLTVQPGTILLVDEPERHLHRSIIEPLLSALFNERSDCSFIVSTHEIELPMSHPDSKVLITRSCTINGDVPAGWDVQVLESGSDLPVDLKRSILGSRRRILFVEGKSQSLDQSLYEALFPGISVVAKGTAQDVIAAVKGLRGSATLHHTEAFGLIDKDFREEPEIARLAEEGIFALDLYSVESLYYCSDAMKAAADHRANYFKWLNPKELVDLAVTKALDTIGKDASLPSRMAARRSEQSVKNRIREQSPTWEEILGGKSTPVKIVVDSPFDSELAKFNALVIAKNLDEIVARYPVRQSGILSAIRQALGINKKDYQRLLPTLVRDDAELANKLRSRIKALSDALT